MSPQTPEQRIQNKIIAFLKKESGSGQPVFWDKRQAGGFTYKVGLPDLYFVYKGRHCEIEIKAPNGKRSSPQITWEQILTTAGIPYAVVNSLESFKEFYDKIKEGS